jgi:hypothetical protein
VKPFCSRVVAVLLLLVGVAWPDASGPVVSIEPVGAIEQVIDSLTDSRDYLRAKELEVARMRSTPDARRLTLHASGVEHQALCVERIASGVVIDTGIVRSFSIAEGDDAIWVAAAGVDTLVRVYRSEDLGLNWEQVLVFSPGVGVPEVEVVYGPGDSSFVYVFYLAAVDGGDLRVLRIDYRDAVDSLAWVDLEVAVGPDTITAFSVDADRDDYHYLYCLYADENRVGRNGSFTRSLDFGRSWEITQNWWNCQDPYVCYGSGSTVHCAWRYAATGREIHVETNRYYGRPRRWRGHKQVSGYVESCSDPVVVQADTVDDARATAWVCYTAVSRTGRRRHVEFAYSRSGGAGWAHVGRSGENPWLDEWVPALASVRGPASGRVYMACVAGQLSPGGQSPVDKTVLLWRSTSAWDPVSWSGAVRASVGQVASGEGVNPQLVVPTDAPRHFPLLVYSRRDPAGARGLYASAFWLPGVGEDKSDRAGPVAAGNVTLRYLLRGQQVRFEFDARLPGRWQLTVYDAAGRLVERLLDATLDPGIHAADFGCVGRVGGTYFARLVGPGGVCAGQRLTIVSGLGYWH